MDFDFLTSTQLFQGCSPTEIRHIVESLGAEQREYARGEVIYSAGDSVQSLGVVLSGRVQIENDDPWGNKSVLDSVGPGMVFAETYACLPGELMMVSAVASEPSGILFLNVLHLLADRVACSSRNTLIQNLLAISAQKNVQLSRRIFHTSSKSIRGRLFSYLSFQAARSGSNDFFIPFNRQQLADYLSVDRSALSSELGKMRRDGLLEVRRNHFILKTENGFSLD